MNRKRRLAFISTVFLLPADAGGKIRSGNVLRGMKGGAFEITLVSPASAAQQQQWGDELKALCDHFVAWAPAVTLPRWTRGVDLLRTAPANVVHGLTATAKAVVARTLADGAFDVVVFDFVQAAALVPAGLSTPMVCFTHNVEAEIFARHAQQAEGLVMQRVWASQAAKMLRFEGQALRRFDRVIAVSERDGRQFEQRYQVADPQLIPTGVDLDFFAWHAPPPVDAQHPPTVVFTGSMDWAANVDGVRFFLADVWPRVLAQQPQARFVVVGRDPPAALVREAQALAGVSFTGFVDDVRTHVHGAHVFVIPLRVGGGTRIKAFEAMGMGCPVVSTRVGIEGLDVQAGQHYLECDAPAELAHALLGLLADASTRLRLSIAARGVVESHFSHRVVSQAFEKICLGALRPAPVVQPAAALSV